MRVWPYMNTLSLYKHLEHGVSRLWKRVKAALKAVVADWFASATFLNTGPHMVYFHFRIVKDTHEATHVCMYVFISVARKVRGGRLRGMKLEVLARLQKGEQPAEGGSTAVQCPCVVSRPRTECGACALRL